MQSDVHMQLMPGHVFKGLSLVFVYDIKDVECFECGNPLMKPPITVDNVVSEGEDHVGHCT